MEQWSLAGLIAALERTLAAVTRAGRVLFGSVRTGSPAKAPAAGVTEFGEYEKVEESKYFPPAPPHAVEREEGELPDRHGRTRLVMLSVDPLLVHAYWQLTPDDLAEAKKRMGGASPRAVLRFYEAPEAAADKGRPAGWFDVEVDLQPGNWYVRLWSADKRYYADLGLKGDTGELVALARSEPIRTPRAWPVVEVAESFLRVEAGQQCAEATPPPRAKTDRSSPAAVSWRLPAGAESTIASGETGARHFPAPIGSAETLRRRLEEFHAIRGGLGESAPDAGPPAGAPLVANRQERGADLAAIAEVNFTPGISSPAAWGKRPED